MAFDLGQTIALLSRTPAVLDVMLRDLPDVWTMRNEGANTWTAYDVVGHLIHGEHTDWIPRAKMILREGDAKPFPPFDRQAQFRDSQGKSLARLVDEFTAARKESLDELQALRLQPEDFARRGMHPALGSVTLRQLLATWVVHDMTHIHQISRIMAHQYGPEVGPWSAYLGVLHCTGHSG